MGKIEIIKDKGVDLDKIRDVLCEALTKICHNYELNYYELLGLIDVIRKDIHDSAEAQNENGE